jgi:hypothetical protein
MRTRRLEPPFTQGGGSGLVERRRGIAVRTSATLPSVRTGASKKITPPAWRRASTVRRRVVLPTNGGDRR